MEYTVLVNFIFGCLFAIFGLLVAHYVILSILGLFFKKSYPKTDVKLRYGVVVSARNESKVIGSLIDSIKQSDYPADLVDVFVVAHNCTDSTAEVAREHGATVFVYDNPYEKTKGYALRYLFNQIEKEKGTQTYDGFFIMDADNILAEDYISKMNDAFVANNKQNVITSFRNSKNFGTNVLTALYGLYFLYTCRLEARGRTAMGCSTRVSGTGYMLPSYIVKDGWKYLTLTEDWEFTADELLKGKKILYCDEAMFYDEQPTNFWVMLKQRTRWGKGHFLVCISRFKEILKGLVLPKKCGGAEHKASMYDLMVNIAPVGIISIVLSILQIVFLCLSPLFGDYNLLEELIGYIITLLNGLAFTTVCGIFASAVMYSIEKKRIPKVKLRIKIVSAIFWAIFLIIAVPMEFVSLFIPNMGWSPIPHNDSTGIDQLKNQNQ